MNSFFNHKEYCNLDDFGLVVFINKNWRIKMINRAYTQEAYERNAFRRLREEKNEKDKKTNSNPIKKMIQLQSQMNFYVARKDKYDENEYLI